MPALARSWEARVRNTTSRRVLALWAVGGLIPGYETPERWVAADLHRARGRGDEPAAWSVARGPRHHRRGYRHYRHIHARDARSAEERRGYVIGAACIVDRSNGKADVGGLKLVSLAAVDFPDYDENDLPPELATTCRQ